MAVDAKRLRSQSLLDGGDLALKIWDDDFVRGYGVDVKLFAELTQYLLKGPGDVYPSTRD